jgi:hypothetical protein
MVGVMVGVLLLLVGSVLSLDYCVELYNLVCNGQTYTDIVSVSLRIGFHPLVACIRQNI